MDSLHIHIHSLGSSGEGIGSHKGLKIFVENALPGEEVAVQIVKKKKNYALGKLLKIHTQASTRIQPSCLHFGQCGGCQLMHLSYAAQLLAKQQKVVAALHRIGHITQIPVEPTLPSPHSFHYRNKIQLPVLWNGKELKVGMYRKKTHEIIPISECLIHSPIGEKVLRQLIPLLPKKPLPLKHILIKSAPLSHQVLLIFITSKSCKEELSSIAYQISALCSEVKGVLENVNDRTDNVILGHNYSTLTGKNFIIETLLGKTFKISASAFFQVYSLMAEKLYQKALEWANLKHDEIAVDAYCGVGTLALLASDFAKQIIGIEIVESAIKDARSNALYNRIENAQFFAGRAERLLSSLERADVVFLNPPRKGCDPSIFNALKKLAPRSLIYISCDPATLARDLSILKECNYSPKKVQPFDLFPQTMHVETLVFLEKTED